VLRAQTAQTAPATLEAVLPAPVGVALGWLLLNGRSLPHLLSYAVGGLTHPAVRRWRSRGGVVVAWTVRTDEQLEHARRHADNVVFEAIPPP
jgi:hypothetical protein